MNSERFPYPNLRLCLHVTGSKWTELFWNLSKTGGAFLQVQIWISLEPFRTGFSMMPRKQKANLDVRFASERFLSGPVQA